MYIILTACKFSVVGITAQCVQVTNVYAALCEAESFLSTIFQCLLKPKLHYLLLSLPNTGRWFPRKKYIILP